MEVGRRISLYIRLGRLCRLAYQIGGLFRGIRYSVPDEGISGTERVYRGVTTGKVQEDTERSNG